MHRPSFALTAETGPGTVRLRVTGDLDHETTGELVGAVRLHLDDRPPLLERFLDITGTLEHLTAPPVGEPPGRAEDSGRRPGAV